MAVVGDKENNGFIYIHGNFSTFKDFNILSNSFIKSKNGDFKRINESFFEIPYSNMCVMVNLVVDYVKTLSYVSKLYNYKTSF